jgi:L-lactate dehydrogenase
MIKERTPKVGIIGAGSVGATIAYAAMIRGVARHISIYDIAKQKVEAEVLDLNHGLQFVPMATVDGGTEIEVLSDADVIVMTAGAKQKPGQTRMDLAAINAGICAKLLPEVMRVAPDALLLLVTNPMDVITQIALKVTGLPPERVLGSGTVLDSSRFRYLLATHCGVAVQNVHAYIAGEHGDSEIPLWSSATIGNIPLTQWNVEGHGRLTKEVKKEIIRNVKEAANQVILGKGATNYAVGLAVTNILEAILHNERRILPVSGMLHGFRDLPNVCLSVPRIVGREGMEAPLPMPMTVDEHEGLLDSASSIERVVRELGY